MQLLGEWNPSKNAQLDYINYMTFLKKLKYGERKRISGYHGCRGRERDGGMNR